MTREEAKQVFLSRGYVEVEGGTIYDANKWREACVVISKWLKQESCEEGISREAVLDEINRVGIKVFKTYNDYSQLFDFVDTLPPVNPQERTGYISIDDVMSVFDDFMCGEVDEDGTDTFLEMLKDKAERNE